MTLKLWRSTACEVRVSPGGNSCTVDKVDELAGLHGSAVLKGIETAKARGLKPADLDTAIRDLCRKHLDGELRTPEARRKDEVSHHILRLAYCQSDDKRKWFLAQEVALFRSRLERQTPEQVSHFMRTNGLEFSPVRLHHLDVDRHDSMMFFNLTRSLVAVIVMTPTGHRSMTRSAKPT